VAELRNNGISKNEEKKKREKDVRKQKKMN
jgi:hypothetical protein